MTGCWVCEDEAPYVCENCEQAEYCSAMCQGLDAEEHLKVCARGITIARHHGSHISKAKAWEMIHNPPHGQPLTRRQRGLFWAIYHGKSYKDLALNLNEPQPVDKTKMPLNWSPTLGVKSSDYKQYVANAVIRDELLPMLQPGEFFISLAVAPGALVLTILDRTGQVIRRTLTPTSVGGRPTLNAWMVDALGLVPGTIRDVVNWVGMRLNLGRLVGLELEPNQRWTDDRFFKLFPKKQRTQTCIRPEPIGLVDVETLWACTKAIEPVVMEVASLAHCLDAPVWSRMKSGMFEAKTTCSPSEVLANPSDYESQWEKILATDLSHPIIVMQTETGLDVLDGMYRLAHAHLNAVPTIRVQIVDIDTVLAARIK